jgi:cytochrome bd ubiquinol oxidase subunit I
LALARWMFALTAGTHFLFVALTLGLATLVAIMETRARDPIGQQLVRFWGHLYVINYAVGIVTGLLMEFQFGLAWPGLTDRAGSVFGAPLAMETLVAFFVESTFLGLWIFGWDRLGRRAHLAVIWIVTLCAYLSAYFILVANGFLKHPVGYVMSGGQVEVKSFTALFTNPAALLPMVHVIAGAFLVAGFMVGGVSVYHLRRDPDSPLFKRSLRYGLVAMAAAIIPSVGFGVPQLDYVHWQTHPGWWVDTALYVMLGSWIVMAFVVFLALYVPGSRRLLIYAIPLPYIAVIAGWVFRETGRQPWLIYGVLRTSDAVRPGSLLVPFIAVISLFVVLVALNVTLLARHARRGYDQPALGVLPDYVPTF